MSKDSNEEIGCMGCAGLRGANAGLQLANKLIKYNYEKIQAKSTRRKKALKQLNRAVTEWQRLALQRGHAKDSELTFPGGSKIKFNPVLGEQEDWEGSQVIGEKESGNTDQELANKIFAHIGGEYESDAGVNDLEKVVYLNKRLSEILSWLKKNTPVTIDSVD